jgi:hypothetical protein
MNAAACPWSDYAPGTVSFCEERLCAWVVEPSNAWSSWAYVLVALWLLRQCRTPQGWSARLLAVTASCALIGIGSFAFHGTGIFIGEVIDQVGMFMLSALVPVFYLGRTRSWSDTKTAAVYVAAVVLSSLVLAVVRPAGIPIFALQLAIGMGVEFYARHRSVDKSAWQPFMQSIAIFGVSFVIWAGDISKTVCVPTNHIVTGHAVWHVLDAIAIARLFAFYRAWNHTPNTTSTN